MKTQTTGSSVKLWLSANDTQDWARKPGASWPGSTIAGRRLFVEFDSNGLLDMALDSGRGSQDCDGSELSAMSADFLVPVVPADHPARPYCMAGEGFTNRLTA